MKTTIKLLCALWLLNGCQRYESKAQTDEIVLLLDRTDSFIGYPPVNAIEELSGVHQNIWKGLILRIKTISDIDSDTSVYLEFTPKDHLTNSSRVRKKELHTFISDFGNSYKTISRYGKSTRSHSSVYWALATTVNQLALSGADKKCIILSSDCNENDIINAYNPTTFDSIQNYPDAIAKQLESVIPLGHLSGITIYIYHKPPHRIENLRFRIMSAFFRNLLEKHHAIVKVGYDLSVN